MSKSKTGETEVHIYYKEMFTRYSYISLIAMLTLAASCGKTPVESTDSGVPICFSVNTMQNKTKGISITTETLKDARVIVKGKEGGGDIWYNYSTDLNIKPEDATSNNWFPSTNGTTGVSDWRNWNINQHSYSFESYAYTPTDATSSTDTNTKGKLTVTSPQRFTLTQPKNYSYKNESSTMVDYLLSHSVTADGAKKNIVNLLFEHALSMVEIYVLRDDAITSVEVSNLTFKNFYRDIRMEATSGAISDRDYIEWGYSTIANTTRDANYVMSGRTFTTVSNRSDKIDFDSRYGTGSGKESDPAIMRSIVVPQQIFASANSTEGTSISVTYRVNMARYATDEPRWTGYMTQTFPLVADGLPAKWEPGYKYTYIIIIDPGVHFTAKVARWVDGGNIEATILPEIVTPDIDSD